MLRILKAIPDTVISLLYPQSCTICKQSVENYADGVTCRSCWSATKIFTERDAVCTKCGLFLSRSENSSQTYCGRCDDQHFDIARAVGTYDDALSAAVIRLKHTPSVAKTARNYLTEAALRNSFDKCELIIPVPISKQRLLERGFNQAAVLAGIVGRSYSIPVDEQSLQRTVHTPMHRAAMDRKARETTVKNAFSVVRPKFVEGRSILLIDDVLTSGSTASYCAKVLKKKGAVKVSVLTLARAV